jgi:uncharacterized phage protein (TIGR01671 family)
MNREIKFRGFDPVEKKLYYPKDLFNLQGFWYEDTPEGVLQGALIIDSMGVRRHFELSQYTGLKDKNRREIYDGDVLKVCAEDINKGSVHEPFCHVWFINGSWVVSYNHRYSEVSCDLSHVHFLYEVVGNLFENPELLK